MFLIHSWGATDATGSAISFESLCPQGTSFPEKPRGSPKKFFNYTGVSALRLKTLRILLLKQTMWDPVTKRILPKAITHKLRFLLTSPKVSSPGQPCWCWLRGQAVGHRGRQHLLYLHTVFQAEQPAGFLESWRHSVLPTTLQGPWRGASPLPPLRCLVRSPWCPLSHRAEGQLESHAVACASEAATCSPEGR